MADLPPHNGSRHFLTSKAYTDGPYTSKSPPGFHIYRREQYHRNQNLKDIRKTRVRSRCATATADLPNLRSTSHSMA